MRVKILATLLATLLLTFGLVLRQRSSLDERAMGIDAHLSGIAEVYEHTVKAHAATIRRMEGASIAVQERLNDVERSIENFPTNASLDTRIQALHTIQRTLLAFIEVGKTDPIIATDPHFLAIAHEMTEAGEARKRIDAYNELAILWNQRVGSLFGSVLTNGTENTATLPFLSFDGSKEYAPLIRL